MGRLNYSGLVVAGVGFFLTRFTVTLAVNQDPLRFYTAGVVPLALGLGLSAFGVALTVADVDRSLVRTTAAWCVVGAVTMFVLVILTLLGSSTDGMPTYSAVRSRTYLSNFLIGGSVGGTFTGLYAARNRRQRDQLRREATRLEVLNSLLRHEVLNALTVIRGYGSLRTSDEHEVTEMIADRSDAIEGTIEEVQYLTEGAGADGSVVGPVSVREQVEESVATVRERHPGATVTVDSTGADPTALANDRLSYVFTHIVENAVVHTDGEVTVTTDATAESVRVTVSDEGDGLPDAERRLLEDGDVASGDGPGAGFGLYFVRFLVESYDGTIEVEVGSDGTDVTVVLSRAVADATGLRASASDPTGVRPAVPQLAVIVGASLVAGVMYGLGADLMGGSIGIIGVLYGTGTQSAVVGWLTHQFHSVVFGFVFAGLLAVAPRRYHDSLPAYVLVGTGWALVLWFVAAGFVSAIWFRMVGIPVPIPSLSSITLVAHIGWGPSLGLLTWLGYRHVSPWLARYVG